MTSLITPYCISVFIINKDKIDAPYLLIKRAGEYLKGTWQMVTGGIDPFETAWEAAYREIFEETGLRPSKLYSADAVETFYLKIKDKVAFVPVFVAYVEGNPCVQLSVEEHDAYSWVSYEEALERLVWSEQKRILTHVHQQFVLKKPHDLLEIQAPPSLLIENYVPKKHLGPVLENLFSSCLGHSSMNRVQQLLQHYACLKDAKLWVGSIEKQIVACAGFNPQKDVLMHLAVDRSYRRKGIGRRMLNAIAGELKPQKMQAETDHEAIQFYRSCGFSIESLGDIYPHTIRYRCVKQL